MILNEIRLLVQNFNECFRFYQNKMGLKWIWGEEGGDFASFRVGEGITLTLYKRDLMAKAVKTEKLPKDQISQDKTALIFYVENLEKTVNELRNNGIEFVNEPHDRPDWGIRVVHFRDPEGNLIEINTPMPKDKWTKELREADQKYHIKS
ncbi:MAG: VOC family protein [Promethearchaeota archaeon]